jgi:hypothetical protein
LEGKKRRQFPEIITFFLNHLGIILTDSNNGHIHE